MDSKIKVDQYINEIKRRMNLNVRDEIIKKDLLLTLILAEFEKFGLGKELIFKGGTLLSRNYLNYHRFSEDLDFVFKDSMNIRDLPRNARERKVKTFLDYFTPELKKVTNALGLDFSTDRSNKKYCHMLSGRVVYTFKIYYSDTQFIKVEINFIEKLTNKPEKVSIKSITDFFDSKNMLYELGLSYQNFNVLSYPIEEITLEKYRAILTRNKLKERDLFDLFLIKASLEANVENIIDKIKSSALIKKNLIELINEKLILLQEGKFFQSEERIEELSIIEYNQKEFENFKQKIQPKLIEICEGFLSKESIQN